MARSNTSAEAQSGSGALDVAQLESLSQQVVGCMQSLRELFCARATALEDCRLALEEYHLRLMEENEQCGRRESELCDQFEARQAELMSREQRLDEETRLLEARGESTRVQLSEFEAKSAALREREESIAQIEQRLAGAQKALQDKTARMEEEMKNLETGRQRLAAAESEMEARRRELEQESRNSESLRCQIAEMQRDWELRMKELNQARQSLTTLQTQVSTELEKLTEQHDELLPRFGTTDGQDGKKQAKGGLPAAGDAKARESLKRFQKLCRDAKRRAVGAG